MIISDEHKFVFVHIPKCAGTFVRQQLQMVDSYNGRFGKKGVHPSLGAIDYSHLPLEILSEYFPVEFEKIKQYQSTAFIRDPYDRFVSSIMQRLREFSGHSEAAITPDILLAEARRVIHYLDNAASFLPLEYVHFNQQTCFTMFEGQQIVNRLYLLQQMPQFADFARSKFGISFKPHERKNVSMSPRSKSLGRFLMLLRPIYTTILPSDVGDAIWNRFRHRLYVPASNDFIEIFEDTSVRSFVDDYYASDIALFRSLNTQRNREKVHSIANEPH